MTNLQWSLPFREQCGRSSRRGGALIIGPSAAYKVLAYGDSDQCPIGGWLDTPGALLSHRAGQPSSVLVTPAQPHGLQASTWGAVGGQLCHLQSLPPSHQHQLPRLLTLASTVTATDCWGTVTATVGGSPRIPVPADMPCGGTQN